MRLLVALSLFSGLSLITGCQSDPPYKYKIAVIPKGLTHEHWQSVHRGADRAASDLAEQGIRVKILWDGPRKESEATEQINLIKSKVAMGAQALVLAPQHSKQMVPEVERTVAAGVPVIIIDSNLDEEVLQQKPDLIQKYVATNNYEGGRLAAKKLLELLQKDGKEAPNLILFRYAPGSESTEQREKGFLDFVNEKIKEQKEAGKPTITFLSKDEYAGPTAETGERKATPLLTRFREKGIDGIFASNESATMGMLNAIRSNNLEKRPRIVGFDSSEPLLQAMREDRIDGTVIQDPYRIGYLGVLIAVQHLEGHDVSEGGQNLYTGEHFLTKDNLDTEEMQKLFNKEAQQKRTVKVPSYKKKS